MILKKHLIKESLLLLILLFSIQNIFGQENSYLKKGRPYIVKIFANQKQIVNKGVLYKVTDSSVIVISEIDYYNFKNSLSFKQIEIPIKEIDKIKISRKGYFIKSLGIATATGATLGAIAGFSSSDGQSSNNNIVFLTTQEKAIILGVGGAIAGIVAGSIIGFVKTTIPINKKAFEFKISKAYLEKRSLINE